jgi:acetyl-CoA carboxylase carboxyl transferase subunit beta
MTKSSETAPNKKSAPRRRDSPMQEVPDDLWVKCPGCDALLYSRELEQNLKVCQRCGYHFRISAGERIAQLVDEDSFVERDAGLTTMDPLKFPEYKASLSRYQGLTGRKDSMIWGKATVEARPIVLGVSEFGFMGGSMGSVMGEKVTRAAEAAAADRHPLVLVSSGGGARMHEGIVSLMQMAKTSAAISRLGEAKVPFISIFADPMMAGIAASYAFIADFIIAEPGAIVGFAGPRVVEQAYRIKLPPGAMSSEFHFTHGMIDMVIARKELRPQLARLLAILK